MIFFFPSTQESNYIALPFPKDFKIKLQREILKDENISLTTAAFPCLCLPNMPTVWANTNVIKNKFPKNNSLGRQINYSGSAEFHNHTFCENP